MNSLLMEQYLDFANPDELIEVNIFSKPIEFLKKDIDYMIKDKTIIITDNYKKEVHLLNTNSIKSMRIIKPKFKPISWCSKMDANAIGVETQ